MMGLEPTTFCIANRPGLVMLPDNPSILSFLSSLSSSWIRLFGDKVRDKERGCSGTHAVRIAACSAGSPEKRGLAVGPRDVDVPVPRCPTWLLNLGSVGQPRDGARAPPG